MSETASKTPRLRRQLDCVRELMLDGRWRTLSDIRWCLGPMASEASISARLRDLRKPQHGGYRVERRKRSGNLYEYRVIDKDKQPCEVCGTLIDSWGARTEDIVFCSECANGQRELF